MGCLLKVWWTRTQRERQRQRGRIGGGGQEERYTQ